MFGPGVRCVGSEVNLAGCSVQVLQMNSYLIACDTHPELD
jgi:hypothetical protein